MDGHDEVDVDDDCHDDDDLVAIGLAYRHLPWRPTPRPPPHDHRHHHHDRTPFCCARCCAIMRSSIVNLVRLNGFKWGNKQSFAGVYDIRNSQQIYTIYVTWIFFFLTSNALFLRKRTMASLASYSIQFLSFIYM